MTAPFSPALIAGMMLPPLATPLIGHVAQNVATRLWRRHRHNFDRLEDYEGTIFLIDPTDLPWLFLLQMSPHGPHLRTLNKAARRNHQATAIIRGPIQALLCLAEGKVDGDALFFARELKIEGNTEAVVALRNAVDDAEIDLVEECTSTFGPLAKPAAKIAGRAVTLAGRITEDFDRLQRAIAGPMTGRLEAQQKTIGTLTGNMAALEQKIAKQAARIAAFERTARHGKT